MWPGCRLGGENTHTAHAPEMLDSPSRPLPSPCPDQGLLLLFGHRLGSCLELQSSPCFPETLSFLRTHPQPPTPKHVSLYLLDQWLLTTTVPAPLERSQKVNSPSLRMIYLSCKQECMIHGSLYYVVTYSPESTFQYALQSREGRGGWSGSCAPAWARRVVRTTRPDSHSTPGLAQGWAHRRQAKK